MYDVTKMHHNLDDLDRIVVENFKSKGRMTSICSLFTVIQVFPN